jgi:hypothetical protein
MEKFSDNNFQVINMNYKLKKIKNKKKNKNNYKNIETFETLENINNISKNETQNQNIEGFKDSDYDGIDNVKDNKKKGGASPIDKLTELINKIYNSVVNTNHVIAKKIAMLLSKNKATEKDVIKIRQYIAWSESILAAAYVTYNMFFIMYYKDIDKTKLIDISRKRAEEYEKELNDKRSLFIFPFNIFLYFFKYSIYLTEVINYYLTNNNGNENKDVNYSSKFLFIFIFLVIFFKFSASFMKDFLISALKFKYTIFSVFVLITIVLLWGSDFVTTLKEKIVGLGKGGSISDFCLFLLNRFIKLLIVIFVGVPMSVIMFVFYIYIYAFGSIIYYKNFSFTKIYETITNINEFIKNSKMKKEVDKNSFMEMLGVNYIMSIIDFMYSKLILMAFIIIYIIGCFDYYKNISSTSGNLKKGLIFLNICLISIFTAVIMMFYTLEQRNEIKLQSNGGSNGVPTGVSTSPSSTGPSSTGPSSTGPSSTGPSSTGPSSNVVSNENCKI